MFRKNLELIKSLLVFFTLIVATIIVMFVSNAEYPWLHKLGIGLFGVSITFFISIFMDKFVYSKEKQFDKQISSIFGLFTEANLIDATFDKEHNSDLIRESIIEAIQGSGKEIKIMGTTLNSILGELNPNLGKNPILTDIIFYDVVKRSYLHGKTIKVLILNPCSQQGITRSLLESNPMNEKRPPYHKIMDHSWDVHKSKMLNKHFNETKAVIEAINNRNNGIKIDCKVYHNCPPVFSISYDDFALIEPLILGEPDNPNEKIAGKLPLMKFRKGGTVKKAIDNNFDFVWENLSTPLEDFNIGVESRYFKINQFLILSNLQRLYWERQWGAERTRVNKHLPIYNKFESFLKEGNGTELKILDLGCGNGGGGAMEFLKDAIEYNHKIEFIDVSQNAIQQFIDRCLKDKKIKNIVSNNLSLIDKQPGKCQISFKSADILSYLREKRKNGYKYDFVYANLSIIYMPRIKTREIFKEIYRVLKPGQLFCGLFWHTNYFQMDLGADQDKQQRPKVEFVKVPLYEDLRIVAKVNETDKNKKEDKKGEIRRFYRDHEELIDELTKPDEDSDSIEKEYFNWSEVNTENYGDDKQNILLWAIK